MKAAKWRKAVLLSIRKIVFGLEDSLVSTLGTVTGIAIGTRSSHLVILSGFVLLAAEGMSMAAGSYLSSKSADEADRLLHKAEPHEHASSPVRAGTVMGICYFMGGLVPLLPYFFLPIVQAISVSIPITAAVLFLVGYWSGTYTKRPRVRSGVEMVLISLSAAALGYLMAVLVSWYFGTNVVN